MSQETFFATAAIFIGFVMIFLTGFTWVQQDRAAWPWTFRALLAAATVWLVAYSFDFIALTLTDKIALMRIQYVGITMLPVFWFLFSLHFVNQAHRLKASDISPLFVLPAITLLFAFTNDFHHWLWARTSLLNDNGIAYLSNQYGPWFWIHTAYAYILLLIGTIFMLRGVFRFSGHARLQALILTTAVFFPWIANVVFLAGLNPFPAIDWTPFSGALSCIGFMAAIFGFERLPWQADDPLSP